MLNLDEITRYELSKDLDDCRMISESHMAEIMKDYNEMVKRTFRNWKNCDEQDIEWTIKDMERAKEAMDRWFDRSLEIMEKYKTK